MVRLDYSEGRVNGRRFSFGYEDLNQRAANGRLDFLHRLCRFDLDQYLAPLHSGAWRFQPTDHCALIDPHA
jgi:hypothetical protein